ncbi:hypothetical protein [Glacieibacterium sp.]|uniref:hypothetical protein n=1 Tax=Glacieibacterium sp. TaxID=2860237 RepID=UPI003AFFA5CD
MRYGTDMGDYMKLALTTIAAAACCTTGALAQAQPATLAPSCETLPIGGAGSATGGNGVLTVAGSDARRELRLDDRPVMRLKPDVASATIHAACRSGATDYYLLGIAGPAGSACAIRYEIAEVGPARKLRLSPRFGSCAPGATASLDAGRLTVTMPAGAGSPVNVTYRYDAGRIAAVAPPVVAVAAPSPPIDGRAPVQLATWAGPPACAIIARITPLENTPATTDVLLAEFRRSWPVQWQTRGRLRSQRFGPAALRSVVTELACLAALPGADRQVFHASRPLFESRRHGRHAFEQLDEVARGAMVDPGVRAAARTFHANMRYEVDMERLH